MLSLRTKHALRALTALAEADGATLRTSELAEMTRAPRGYLETILTELTRHGLIRSVRGRGGGFLLARPADAITFAAVIRALEGPLALAPCASQTRYARCADCIDEQACTIRDALIKARDATADVFEQTTIASAVLKSGFASPGS